MEDATIFLHISIETKHWPFSIRNESDVEFLFFQSNPNLAEDEEEDQQSNWKPVRYKLPPEASCHIPGIILLLRTRSWY